MQQEGVATPSRPVLEPGAVVDIPVEGALGLLALGARGIIAWRQKRDEVLKLKQQKEQGEDE